jgi:hypothetical protein
MSSIDPIAYPFPRPEEDFLYFEGTVLALDPASWPRFTEGRTAVLAYGSNAAPEQLRRKFGDLEGGVEIPTYRTVVTGHDVVHAAFLAAYGSVPATIVPAAGTELRTWLQFLSPRQLERMDETEGLGEAYSFEEGFRARLPGGEVPAFAYVALAGPLRIDGEPVGLAGVEAPGSPYRRMGQSAALEAVRGRCAPALSFVEFRNRITSQEAFRRRIRSVLRGDPPPGPPAGSAPGAGSRPRSGE